MKGLFSHLKSTKKKTPVELIKYIRQLLICVDKNANLCESKISELKNSILEIRTVLFGDDQTEPNSKVCEALTKEFFREDTFRLLIVCLPRLELGFRRDAFHVIANLQGQKVECKLTASGYLEKNLDLLDILISGYELDEGEDGIGIALTYGAIARECIRHQSVAKYVLESQHLKKFFRYFQNPHFDVASDAQETFKQLLTRHKSIVGEFLTTNYEWFFQEYNSQLLESHNYLTRRQAVKLLGGLLYCGSNSGVRVKYLSSLKNLKVLMNLLRDPNKCIQLESLHVFKLFVENQNKPPEIICVLLKNKSKLLHFIGGFNIDRLNEEFEADKSLVIREITALEPRKQLPVLAL